MARILKNKTAEMVSVSYANVTVEIDATSQKDLAETFEAWQLAASESLLLLLGQGTDKYQLNDGTNDLTVSQAIDLVRGYAPPVQHVVADLPLPTVKPNSPKITLITPNWCDQTTWHQGSTYVEDATATDSGDHTTYTLAHQYLIDTYHGRITFEDYLKDSAGRNYRVVVKVDGQVKTERDPHLGSGGDYEIDYVQGKIVFFQTLTGSEVVTATYHYAASSTFTLKPTAGKKLILNQVEVQFSEDIEMNDSVVFQAYGYVQVFAPQLMEPPYNLPSGTLIPLGDPLVYKTIGDLINDSNHSYPAYPVIGGSNWRAQKKATYIFAWDYTVGATYLYSTYGMEVRISLQHEAPCGGSYATATMYCTSEDEGL